MRSWWVLASLVFLVVGGLGSWDGFYIEKNSPRVREHVRLLPGAAAEFPAARQAVQEIAFRDLPQNPCKHGVPLLFFFFPVNVMLWWFVFL